MPIAASHSLADKKKRKPKMLYDPSGRSLINTDNYNRTEDILDEMYCDFANGLLESEIKKKLISGLYPSQNGVTMKQRNAYDYIDAVKKRITADYEEHIKTIRESLYLNYMTIYQEALANGDRFNAKNTLDSIAKLTGANQDKPTTAVQINNAESGLTINFGFGLQKDDE